MERPYDHDLELLMNDLNVHSYIAHRYSQEQIAFGKTAKQLQEEIFTQFWKCEDDSNRQLQNGKD